MRKLIYLEGVFSSPYFLTTQGAIFTGLAIEFGLDEFLLGITSSFPVTAQVFQLLSPLIAEKISSRKKLTVIFVSGARVFWPLVILLLFLFNVKNALAFSVLFAVSQISVSIGNSIWISWLKDSIPLETRGLILGRRNLFVSLSSMIAMYSFGILIDGFGKRGYEAVLVITALTSLISSYFMNRMEDIPLKRSGFLASLRRVLRDENFMKLVKFFFFWNIVIMSTSVFFSYHLIKNLEVPMTYIGLVSALASVVSIFFYWLYSKISDEVGHKTIAELGIIAASTTAMMWFFMSESTYRYLMLVDALLTGMGWSAINLSFTTLPMEVAAGSEPAYFSFYYAMGGIGGFIGSFIGGTVGKALAGVELQFHGHHIYGLQFMFFFGGIARMFMLGLLSSIPVKRYIPVRKFVYNSLALMARRVPLRPVEYSIGVIRSRLLRVRRESRERGNGGKGDKGKQGSSGEDGR